MASEPAPLSAPPDSSQLNGDVAEVAPLPLLEAGTIIAGRYRIDSPIGAQGVVHRYRGSDLEGGLQSPMPVVILCEDHRSEPDNDDAASWPSIRWEKRTLARSSHLSLPRVFDSFEEGGRNFLIEELPEGRSFWDAWDETPVSWPRRCGWLIHLAEALERLANAGAILELSPERVVVSPTDQAVVVDLSTLLPLPVPPIIANCAAKVGQTFLSAGRQECLPHFGRDAFRGSRSTAPELLSGDGTADARAMVYSFGAMVQSLLLGRELTDFDFTPLGRPRPYVERFSDAHPLLGRLLGRTYAFDPRQRFPVMDRTDSDPSGMREVIELLEICSRNLDAIRLEISAWTNTGLVRTSNEDAVAVLHSAESLLEENDNFAVLILADGMGGMAGGEIAAAMTIRAVRDYFLKQPPFANLLLTGTSRTLHDGEAPKPEIRPSDHVKAALREANRAVFERSRADESLDGMGCTAEVVLIDGRHAFVGHVGDSRTYHYRAGKLTQVTQDQTLVARLVQLGQLTEEEAERHPQRSELQQAIGGRGDIYPDDHAMPLESGDWLVLCTDGLSNMLRAEAITDVLQSAGSAEKAARRLINQALIAGGSDNVSLIVVRVC